jgi:hypothetical protein
VGEKSFYLTAPIGILALLRYIWCCRQYKEKFQLQKAVVVFLEVHGIVVGTLISIACFFPGIRNWMEDTTYYEFAIGLIIAIGLFLEIRREIRIFYNEEESVRRIKQKKPPVSK